MNSYTPRLIAAALLASIAISRADHVLGVPAFFGNTYTVVPLLLWQENFTSMRYQQVYGASAFTTLKPTEVYLTRILIFWDENTRGTIFYTTNLQIHLSTTSKMPDGLSTNFAENVGLDDMAVFVTNNTSIFTVPFQGTALVFTLPKPFVYHPAEGNLLMDVRIETPKPGGYIFDELDANDDPTDAISRVYAGSINATQATVTDTVGLRTAFQFNEAPSLIIYTSTFNTPTNFFAIEWPSQPSVFVLQQSARLGTNAIWQTVTNATAPRYYFPVKSSGPGDFYRLIWPSGQLLRPAGISEAPTEPQDSVHLK